MQLVVSHPNESERGGLDSFLELDPSEREIMFANKQTALKPRKPRRGSLVLERLESRALMAVATEAFAPPDLSGLITQAFEGVNTSAAAISTMLTALETQLENGPLADLTAGRA